MVFGIVLLVVLYLLYVLLVRGLLWKIFFVIFGWGAIYAYLSRLESFQNCPLTISDYTFSWAAIVPTALVFMVMLHTKEE